MSIFAGKMFTQKQKLFIPVTAFSGFEPSFYVQSSGAIGTNMEVGFSHNSDVGTFEGGTGITGEHFIDGADAPNRIVSAGAGVPRLLEISTTGVVGLLMAAAGDDVHHFMEIPANWDRRQPIEVRVIYTTLSGTAADTITWKFLYDLITTNTTRLDTGAPATTLDTVLVIETVTGVSRTVERSAAAGVIDKGKLGTAADYWEILVEMDAFAGGLSEDKFLLGIEFEYTLRSGRGHRRTPSFAFRA